MKKDDSGRDCTGQNRAGLLCTLFAATFYNAFAMGNKTRCISEDELLAGISVVAQEQIDILKRWNRPTKDQQKKLADFLDSLI